MNCLKEKFLVLCLLVAVAMFSTPVSAEILIPTDTSVGTWDLVTRTYTLTSDVSDTLNIVENNLTLDGNGHSVTGTGTGYGVYASGRSSVTIKNLNVSKFYYGIFLFSSSITLTGNIVLQNYCGIYVWYSSFNTLTANTVSENYYGIRLLYYSHNNTLTANTVSKNSGSGIDLRARCDNNTLTANTVSENYYGIFLETCWNNTLTGNIASRNYYGIYIADYGGDQIYNNNFIENSTQAYVRGGSGYLFNKDKPIGGNYWSDWTGPDTDEDGFVDLPYVFAGGVGGVDYLPWTHEGGWLNNPPVADAGDDQTIEATGLDGAEVTLDGSGSSDDGQIQPLTYTWTWAGGSATGVYPTVTLTLPLGMTTVTLAVEDGQLSDTDTVDVTVQDTTPPTFTSVPQDKTIRCDGNGNQADLSDWLASTVAAADFCGDVAICGEVTITDDFTGFTYDCGNTGSVTVTWTAEDEYGNTAAVSGTFTIEDPTRAVTYDGDMLLSTGGSSTVNANLIAKLRDNAGDVPDIDGKQVTFTLTADGIGTIIATADTQNGVAQTVRALEPAIYMIEVTLGCSDFTASAILVVYNPDGGFATGGGWFVPEADGLNTHASVRANFGFNAKYIKGDPTGHLEFRYSDGYIDLKSSSIDQLVITGGRIVQFKGLASVSGEGGNSFFVKAIDNGEPGSYDSFEIKIWAPGIDPEGDPSERAGGILEGGNIVVHTK